jgi:hypothetical protein
MPRPRRSASSYIVARTPCRNMLLRALTGETLGMMIISTPRVLPCDRAKAAMRMTELQRSIQDHERRLRAPIPAKERAELVQEWRWLRNSLAACERGDTARSFARMRAPDEARQAIVSGC